MRDLASLQVYANEELERAKLVRVRTAETCVVEEGKILEIINVIDALKKDKIEYKSDRVVDRILLKLECARNFLRKQTFIFTNVEKDLELKRKDLEERRKQNLQRLENSKSERQREVEQAKLEKEGSPALVSPELKVKRSGNPNFKKGSKNPYYKKSGRA